MSADDKTAPRTAVEGWDTGSRDDFFTYYESASQSANTLARFEATTALLLRVMAQWQPQGRQSRTFDVLDVGCGAGAQSHFWQSRGHRYRGIDINRPLIELARRRVEQQQQPEGPSVDRPRGQDPADVTPHFDVGTATDLPVDDGSVDICLLPELLEHVADWESCLDEAVRVLRPGGCLYINTSSKLCPAQQEFDLPLYSWYPGRLKRYFERRAVTDWPSLANHATYPAVNWFSFYGLRNHLRARGFQCFDRFDVMDLARHSVPVRRVVETVRRVPLLRFLGQVATPYTLVVALRSGTPTCV